MCSGEGLGFPIGGHRYCVKYCYFVTVTEAKNCIGYRYIITVTAAAFF